LTGTTGAFTSSGSDNTFNITHSSGSGIGLNITKGGNGEGLYLNKTSGTGNAATIVGTLNATTLVKSGGTSTQYLMADGTTSTLTNPVTGTGTTNYVSKWTGTSTQAISQIFDNGTNVGIGTTTAAEKLDVTVSSATSTANFTHTGVDGGINIWRKGTLADGRTSQLRLANGTTFFGASDASWQIGSIGRSASTAALFFQYYNGVNYFERMRIDTSGFVGIGNINPAYRLDVSGTLRNTTGAAFATSSGNVLIGTTTDASIKLDVAGNMRSTLGANFATTSGSVGVGTTSPQGKFTVKNATDYNTVFQSVGSFSGIQSLNDAASAYKEMRIDGS
jgi:hypothetical protein